MKAGITTWHELGTMGEVLVIINSAEDDRAAAAMLLDTVTARAGASSIHVVATVEWREWLSGRGIAADRVLLAVDWEDAPLELNYFLQSLEACAWVARGRFAAIVGTSAHNLYNEEVKDIFERRVSLLLGDAMFLAHTIPGDYVYVLDGANLLRRIGRSMAEAEYVARCRGLVEDLHAQWKAGGSPRRSDDPDFHEIERTLARHLGAGVLAFDEASPIPLAHGDISVPIARMLAEVRTALVEAAERVAGRTIGAMVRHAARTRLRDVWSAARHARDTLMRRGRMSG